MDIADITQERENSIITVFQGTEPEEYTVEEETSYQATVGCMLTEDGWKYLQQ